MRQELLLVLERGLSSSKFRDRDAERAATDVVETSAVAELDGLRITTVLTTNS